MAATTKLLVALCIAIALLGMGLAERTASQEAAPDAGRTPVSENEARSRARLLHEAMHATLQIVHHEYYREDEALKIPAATLKRVFREIEKRQHIQLHWLAVNAEAMNVDHKPSDEFERQAVKALNSGKLEYEQIDHGVYRLASAVTLTSDCLKCHAPNRTSNQDRAAALVISMPVQKTP